MKSIIESVSYTIRIENSSSILTSYDIDEINVIQNINSLNCSSLNMNELRKVIYTDMFK